MAAMKLHVDVSAILPLTEWASRGAELAAKFLGATIAAGVEEKTRTAADAMIEHLGTFGDVLKLCAAPPPKADDGEIERLLRRAMTLLREWERLYGQHNPTWLPPAGHVRLLEDADETLKTDDDASHLKWRGVVIVDSFEGFTEAADHCTLASEQDLRHQGAALVQFAIPALRWAGQQLSQLKVEPTLAHRLPYRLTFADLRGANLARLPQFKNKHGAPAHSKPDGSDWTPAQWLQAVLGELGEFANIRKKFERGDLTFEQYEELAGKELADVQTYLDILALRCLDDGVNIHPEGIDLGQATIDKFNEVSARVKADVLLPPCRVCGRADCDPHSAHNGVFDQETGHVREVSGDGSGQALPAILAAAYPADATPLPFAIGMSVDDPGVEHLVPVHPSEGADWDSLFRGTASPWTVENGYEWKRVLIFGAPNVCPRDAETVAQAQREEAGSCRT